MDDTHEAVVRDLARTDPLFLDPGCGELVCVLCHNEVEERGHAKKCVWARAQALILRHGDSAA
jgi:hypothetical protein